MGRPSKISEKLTDEICDRISEGESLRDICAGKAMPNKSTVLRWMHVDDDFATKYARARELQADTIFEQMQDVADDGNPEDVQRAKLRVSTMQWRASKLAPKRYGDKVGVEHTGEISLRPEMAAWLDKRS